MSLSNIPITVFTGFLGAGKTSVILSLLPRLPKDYKVVLLKNEFGDVEVDSQLAKQSSLAAVSEILNGCMCCVLVGQMQTAILEIREKYRPDRIIIECSGSAFPATLAFQIRELERETNNDLKLDAILTVIDAENFSGYEDTSPTARMQASYTDMIIINKSEHVSERALDMLIDNLNTLNDLTPKIRCEGRNGVDPSLILGLDSKLFMDEGQIDVKHHDEVETVTVYKGASPPPDHRHEHDGDACSCNTTGAEERTNGALEHANGHVEMSNDGFVDEGVLITALASLSKETVWRVKGFVRTVKGRHILNWAFGRYELTALVDGENSADRQHGSELVKLTVMGERGEVRSASRKFAAALNADIL